MACCHIRARCARDGADQRESVLRHRAKAGLLERIRDDARIGEMRPQSAFNLSIAPSSGTTRSGSVGRESSRSHTYVVPSARGKISGDRIEPVASAYSRNRASDGIAAPVPKTRLCPFSPNTGGRESHCAASTDQAPSRSRPHRPHRRSRSTPTTSSPRRSSPVTRPSRNSLPAPPQRASSRRKGGRLHLCCGVHGSKLAVDRDVRRKPSGPCSARGR